ncbi:MAG: hypothetical protein K6E59_04395 [Bacilli bacterium]|nr:hypothetical protein [Bacilli bacterium]
MANNEEIYFRYTDLNYVNERDFYKALGSTLLERLWTGMLKYRQDNSDKTALRNLAQAPFTLTRTTRLKAKYNAFYAKLMAVSSEFSKFDPMPDEGQRGKRNALYQCLKAACDLEGVKLSEPTLRTMVAGLDSGDRNGSGIPGYRDYLLGKVNPSGVTLEDSFRSLFEAFGGSKELILFYRTTDPSANLGRAADYAKTGGLDSYIANLEDFISEDPLFPLGKAFLAGFFVSYLEMFEAHNGLAACALTKRLLAESGIGPLAMLLPLESAFALTPAAKDAFAESARTADFTYAFLHFINVLDPLIDGLYDDWAKTRAEAVKREYRSVPHEEKVEPAAVPEEVAPSVEESPMEEVPVAPSEEMVEVPVVTPEPPAQAEEPEEPVSGKGHISPEVPVLESIPAIDPSAYAPRASLSDKEVKMFARYIVETHPDISKQQALFFASHHILGRYYTIQDFKRTMKVAYETARTSMDRLAQAGLYKKLRIKNKYVYTPRNPGEKE